MSAAANNDAHLPLEIHISTDPAAGTISVTDNGVGMSREELVANLGTIARSGSKHFVDQLSSTSPPAATEGGEGGATTGSGGSKSMSASAAEGIIGQFGVGFYSSFMVADRVVVESMSATGASNQPYRLVRAVVRWHFQAKLANHLYRTSGDPTIIVLHIIAHYPMHLISFSHFYMYTLWVYGRG